MAGLVSFGRLDRGLALGGANTSQLWNRSASAALDDHRVAGRSGNHAQAHRRPSVGRKQRRREAQVGRHRWRRLHAQIAPGSLTLTTGRTGTTCSIGVSRTLTMMVRWLFGLLRAIMPTLRLSARF